MKSEVVDVRRPIYIYFAVRVFTPPPTEAMHALTAVYRKHKVEKERAYNNRNKR